MKRIHSSPRNSTARRVRDSGRAAGQVPQSVIATGLSARQVATIPVGLNPATLTTLRREIESRLASSGGRPALEGAARRQKIPLAEEDWRRLVELAERMSDQTPRPTPGQIASAVIRVALDHPDRIELEAAPFSTHAKEGSIAYRPRSTPDFTDLQGQYLAFIHAYSKIHRQPPAEADMQRFFEVTPPSVHRMVLELEKKGLIRRQPGKPRSIELLIPTEALPPLR